MHVEARTAKNRTQDRTGLQPKDAGMRVTALNGRSAVTLGCADVMTIADWGALRLEIHQKLQELKQWGDGCWLQIEPDLEAKVAALEESIR